MESSSVDTITALNDEALSALFTEARTHASFADTPITEDELTAIWNLAKWAPTAANLQPMRLVYVNTPEARERLGVHMNEGNRAKTLAAPVVAVLAVDNKFYEAIPTVAPFLSGMTEVFATDDAMRGEWGTFNSALQAGYFIIAARSLGFAVGPMAGFDSAGVDAEFFSDGRLHSILVVNLGRAGEEAPRPRMPRLDSAEVVQFL
ncbi:malonic semialdehyde reductase [Glaciihabitans sp. dw_435]|uniref:malonic semialdehyde reductase n=1 Tax=Glaciihabitans sp. dw_435 TaxID=2720081 RepID=UPI001BD69FD0|nr:malonic semialdehyde reductase [Glaciihabitans sp. dw_435]